MRYFNVGLKFMNRCSNKIYSFINRLRFSLNGISYGRKCVVHGHVGLSIHHHAIVNIGNNFYMSNGNHMNPLCGNSQGHIHVEKNAILRIGNNVASSSLRVWCSKSIYIGNNVMIGGMVTIIDTDAHSLNWIERRNCEVDQIKKKDKAICIGDDVFIGMHAIILKGVTIGEKSIIGAGSVVTSDVPENSIVAGNPAHIIKIK